MILRLVINNFLSIGQEREFNMLPYDRYGNLKHHIYERQGLGVLKLAAIYGANAAGKSSITKAITTIALIVTTGKLPTKFDDLKHRFSDDDKPITIVIEFLCKEKGYLYGISFKKSEIVQEELYLSGLGETDDQLIFSRSLDDESNLRMKFDDNFYSNSENRVLKNVIEKKLLKKEISAISFLNDLEIDELEDIETAFDWFEDDLHIIQPDQSAMGLAHFIDSNEKIADYAREIMRAYHIGIQDIVVKKSLVKDFFGEDDTDFVKNLISKLDENEDAMINLHSQDGDQLTVVNENGEKVVKQIRLIHKSGNTSREFSMNEESDGSVRLLNFLPLFQGLINSSSVFIIDEIERSIHPILIKELIRKFSEETNTQGQLIFTTHESNLLDQSIFRRDEIWFIEKDVFGCTDMYSLSKFKEHATIDIEKGYLNGRYGGIPFMSNLKDLNWIAK